MNEDIKDINSLIQKINDIKLVPEEELKNMDFYELAYYMQSLNTIEAIGKDIEEGDSDE